jgi:2-keto-4-pentenoate hydratase
MIKIQDDAASIARRFVDARWRAAGLGDYPGDLPGTLDDAYAVQDAAIAAWGKPMLGWKVGRIASPLSERYASDRLAGPIFMVVDSGAGRSDMPVFADGFAAAEAEFVLRIGGEPPPGKAHFTLSEAAELIDAVHVGIEIASSPLKIINDLGPTAIVSDFGNNNGLVVGPEIPNWRDSGFEEWEVATRIDGVDVGRGQASSFNNGAIGSARFLFELMARRGIALAAGQWISSGAVTGVHSLRPGQIAEVRFDRWCDVSCRAVAAEPE